MLKQQCEDMISPQKSTCVSSVGDDDFSDASASGDDCRGDKDKRGKAYTLQGWNKKLRTIFGQTCPKNKQWKKSFIAAENAVKIWRARGMSDDANKLVKVINNFK